MRSGGAVQNMEIAFSLSAAVFQMVGAMAAFKFAKQLPVRRCYDRRRRAAKTWQALRQRGQQDCSRLCTRSAIRADQQRCRRVHRSVYSGHSLPDLAELQT